MRIRDRLEHNLVVTTQVAPAHIVRAAVFGLLVGACGGGHSATPPVAVSAQAHVRLRLCSEAPIHLDGPPGAQQSRGCVATFMQEWSDPATIRWVGARQAERRFLVYAPASLADSPAPVVFVFPGYSSSAEAAAFYYTHTRFESLADRDRFIVVYGNGLPNSPSSGEQPSVPKGGFLQGCLAEHSGEGVDVKYVRRILDLLETELKIESITRIRDRSFRWRRHVFSTRFGGPGLGSRHCPGGGPSVST